MIIGGRSRLFRAPCSPRLAPPGPLELDAALLALFLGALHAFTAVRLDEPADIVASVIIGDLFTRLNVLDGANEHLAIASPVGLAIGAARVISVASNVLATRSVDGPAAVDLVQIFGVLRLHRLGLLVVEAAAGIFNDEGSLRDRCGSEQTQAGAGTADTKRFSLTWHASQLHADSQQSHWRRTS